MKPSYDLSRDSVWGEKVQKSWADKWNRGSISTVDLLAEQENHIIIVTMEWSLASIWFTVL